MVYPPTWRHVGDRTPAVDGRHDAARDILDGCHFRTACFQMRRHWRIGRAWLDQHNLHRSAREPVLQPLGISCHIPLAAPYT